MVKFESIYNHFCAAVHLTSGIYTLFHLILMCSIPLYTLQKIIDGEFDKALSQWAIGAKKQVYHYSLSLVQRSMEIGFHGMVAIMGGGIKHLYGDKNKADGPERFRDAYRHIITLFRQHKVDNITWFLHVNASSYPEESWNEIEQYYPGDTYIDWLGLSVYGQQTKEETYQSFIEIMDKVYHELTNISNKPIAILELGITEI